MESTKIMFRVDKEGEVFALFPKESVDFDVDHCWSYQHVGQHSAANLNHCIRTSRPASEDEYSSLLGELRGYGDGCYKNAVVIQRTPPGAFEKRASEIRSHLAK